MNLALLNVLQLAYTSTYTPMSTPCVSVSVCTVDMLLYFSSSSKQTNELMSELSGLY